MAREISSHDATHHEWLNQGFEEAPFDEKKSNYCHYRSQGFIHALNQLVTLDTTAVCVSHIHGESGAGKTACLKSFQKMPSSYLQVYLPTAEGLSPINLLKTIHFHLKTQLKVVRKPCAEYIVNLAKQLTSQDLRLRIIIDDAHTIPESSLDIIQQLASIQPTGSHIQFLLASHHSIDSLHRNVAWENLRVKTIHIPNLSSTETAKYIKLCLTQSSKELFQPQIPAEVTQKIHQLSQGNIRRINQVAARHLLKHIELCKPSPSYTHAVPFSLTSEQKNFVVTSGIILSCYLVARCILLPSLPGYKNDHVIPTPASVMQNHKMAQLKKISPQDLVHAAEKNLHKLAHVSKHQVAQPASKPTDSVTLTEEHLRPKSNIQPLRVDNSKTQLVGPANPTETLAKNVAQTANQVAQAIAPSVPTHTPRAQAPDPNMAQKSTPSQTVKNVPKTGLSTQSTAQKVTPVAPKVASQKTTQVLEKSTPQQDGFVIQLGAYGLHETRARFCAEHQICDDKLIDYQAERNNHTMRLFVLGPYPDRKTAQGALEQLPASLQKNKPWIKSFDSIQKDLQK